MPATAIDMTQTVFNTEFNALSRPDVLASIDFDIQHLRDFKTYVQKGSTPVPTVVF